MMSVFLEFPFKADYIKSYNLMLFGVKKYNLYIEDDSDKWFWEKFINKFFPNQYRTLSLVTRGKRALEPYYQEAKIEALIAVDSDFDYLCSNIGYGNALHSNPYLLHTFSYSRESALIEKSHIQDFVADINFTIVNEIDINQFIQLFSEHVFNGLTNFIYLKNFNQVELNHDEFHRCFHLTDNQIVTVNSQNIPIIDMNVLNPIPQKLQFYFQSYTISPAEHQTALNHMSSLGVTPANAYRFINGHDLEKLIISVIKQLTATLTSLELNYIKRDFQGKQISERKNQIEKTLKEESQIKTHLRRYLICDNDEVHQNICAQFAALKP